MIHKSVQALRSWGGIDAFLRKWRECKILSFFFFILTYASSECLCSEDL